MPHRGGPPAFAPAAGLAGAAVPPHAASDSAAAAARIVLASRFISSSPPAVRDLGGHGSAGASRASRRSGIVVHYRVEEGTMAAKQTKLFVGVGAGLLEVTGNGKWDVRLVGLKGT